MTTSSSSKYPYPAHLNIANFVSLKLTSNNFLMRETQVLSLIESLDLFGFMRLTIYHDDISGSYDDDKHDFTNSGKPTRWSSARP
jgi:hypothetical protein